MDQRLEAILRSLHEQLEHLYGPRLVKLVLFGSQARGDAGPGSDIDILVVLTPPVHPGRERKRTIEVISSLSLEHDVVISCIFVDEISFANRNAPLLLNIRREGVAI